MDPNDSSMYKTEYDTIDITQRSISEFQTIVKPNFILHLYASRNFFTKLPNMSGFTALREMDLSRNKFVDLSPLADIISLQILNISYNRVYNINFIQELTSLEEFNASNNKISKIDCAFPQSLVYLDLSNNEISDLSFFDENFPAQLESLDISGNSIDQIIELKYISVFQQLSYLRVGLLHIYPDINIVPFVKHLCPSLQSFDDENVANANNDSMDDIANEDELYNILVNGTEQQLYSFLSNKSARIMWDEAKFYPYDADIPPTPLKFIEQRLNAIENQVQEHFASPKKQPPPPTESATLLSPFGTNKNDNPAIQSIQHEIQEIRQYLTQITEILFVHDKALNHLWEK